jgi:hypothetical protein
VPLSKPLSFERVTSELLGFAVERFAIASEAFDKVARLIEADPSLLGKCLTS